MSTNPGPLLPAVSLEPVYLTPDQVAAMFQVKTKTLYHWARKDPTMPVIRIGHTLRFHKERLERWLRDREQGRGRPRRVQGAQAQEGGP